MLHTAFIGIGSNVDNPLEHCRTVLTKIATHPDLTLVQQSQFYKTEPFGKPDQEWFVNLVVQIKTDLLPQDLLETLLKLEKEMGRERAEKWGPRIIDLDILFYDTMVLDQEGLTVPHPGIAERRFVLEPLVEMDPDWAHPLLNKTVSTLLSELRDNLQVERVESNL